MKDTRMIGDYMEKLLGAPYRMECIVLQGAIVKPSGSIPYEFRC